MEEHFTDCDLSGDEPRFENMIHNEPDVLIFNLLWVENTKQKVLACLNLIPDTLRLSDCYRLGNDVDNCEYKFRGLIVYWGCHYYSYIRVETEAGGYQWLKVDDIHLIMKTGWAHIVEECVNSMAVPHLMFFEKMNDAKQDPEMTLSRADLSNLLIESHQVRPPPSPEKP